MARLITHITSLRMPEHPRTTLNVGVISGGTGVNVLASEAQFELDLRSESIEALNDLAAQVEETIRSSQKEGVAVEMRIIGERPAGEIPAEHRLARLAGACLSEQGLTARFSSGSTDANIPLSRGIPAVVVGITTGGGAHTVHEYIDIEPIQKGMRQVVKFVETILSDP
jgi:acetylornithine deacetylase/succinyl-diaminopimelate desuccinylase-like protein